MLSRSRKAQLSAVLVASSLVFAACGDSDDDAATDGDAVEASGDATEPTGEDEVTESTGPAYRPPPRAHGS
jgi:hypothetical protein